MRNLPEILQGVPRWAFLLVVPGAAFVLATIVAFALSGDGGSDTPPPSAPERLTVRNLDVAPSPSPSPTVQATPAAPNRKDCTAIQGTAYQSDDERDWYRANCSNTAAAGTGGGGGGGGGAAAATGGGGGGHVTGSEYGIGARLIIPSIGLDATVTGMDVGPSGAMPDPNGYFNAVLYNFPNHPGMGGSNKVLAGHVDCARCHNGGSGTAVFWSVRSLTAGAKVQYVNPDGSVTNYTVVSSYAVSPQTDWGSIVASGAADMTLITCTGTFSGGEYNNRHVVQLRIG